MVKVLADDINRKSFENANILLYQSMNIVTKDGAICSVWYQMYFITAIPDFGLEPRIALK